MSRYLHGRWAWVKVEGRAPIKDRWVFVEWEQLKLVDLNTEVAGR